MTWTRRRYLDAARMTEFRPTPAFLRSDTTAHVDGRCLFLVLAIAACGGADRASASPPAPPAPPVVTGSAAAAAATAPSSDPTALDDAAKARDKALAPKAEAIL